ncbi:MAG: preprotein translocase subunit YajC [Holosporales bacterium]|jgi:preprotein translocase subunit YajC|nr:preprotein translocase subunit YajC [Holosporales bacterium]
MLFLISAALADGESSQSSGWMSFLPMLAFIAILYFLLIRPQQKKQKQHQALVSAVKKGDKVVTNSGIIATVSKIVNDQEIVLEIADGVYCKFVKSAVSNVLNKEQPLSSSDASTKADSATSKESSVSKPAQSKKTKKATSKK